MPTQFYIIIISIIIIIISISIIITFIIIIQHQHRPLHHMLPQTSPSEPLRCIVHADLAVGGPLATRLRGAPLK